MAQDEAIISFADVGLARGGERLFLNLNVEIRERKVGVIGNNGSGKSSFLRLVNGLLLPEAGVVTVCGLDTRTQRAALPAVAGFLFQNPDHQIVFPTVAEEIGFVLRERGESAGKARETAMQLLASHGHANWADRPVHQLSDGQKQLICILAVTIAAPQIVLLDEPFSSLDLPTRYDLLMRLDMLPQTIVMASHDLDLLMEFDRILWFEAGAIRGDGPPRQVLNDYRATFREAAHPAALAAQ